MTEGPVTIKEIAEQVGVSPSTVSRYLNGKIQNRSRRHDKLDKIILRCGYQLPSRKNKLRILNVRCGEKANRLSLSAQMEQCLQEQASDAGIEMFSVCETDKNVIEGRIRELNCSGVISFYDFGAFSVPVVLMDNDGYCGPLSCVSCDNRAGMVRALEYLKSKGHSRVAYYSDYGEGPSHLDPRRYFMPQAYAAAGFEYDPRLVWRRGFRPGEHQPVIDEAVGRFLSLDPRPTAIFMVGDTYGISFYDALKREGLSVPGDISLVGFDGSPICEMLNPPLTTVAKPLAKMAAEAVSLLSRILESGEKTARRVLIEPDIIERDSVSDRNLQ